MIDTPEPVAAPHGDDDPNVVFIAVALAIDAWERLEAELARLSIALRGTAETPENLSEYGKSYRRFGDRMAATRAAAESYFVKFPDQHKEGQFAELMASTETLAILRHRVAHGHLTQSTPPIRTADLFKDGEPVTLEFKFQHRWGAPFYSMDSLRFDFKGAPSWEIDNWRQKFFEQHGKVQAFRKSL